MVSLRTRYEATPGVTGSATSLELIADCVDLHDFYDANGDLDAYRATREVLIMVGALSAMTAVNDLDAIPLIADDTEVIISLIERYRWNAHERVSPDVQWRRWPTDRLATFVINSMAKVLPSFWWKVDADHAVIEAARIIDGYRCETGTVELDTCELVHAIGFAVIGSDERAA